MFDTSEKKEEQEMFDALEGMLGMERYEDKAKDKVFRCISVFFKAFMLKNGDVPLAK